MSNIGMWQNSLRVTEKTKIIFSDNKPDTEQSSACKKLLLGLGDNDLENMIERVT